jgi:hypothetical protein
MIVHQTKTWHNLQVFYLDNLDSGYTNPSYLCLPRVSDFPYEKIKSIISHDQVTSRDGNAVLFGKLKVNAS